MLAARRTVQVVLEPRKAWPLIAEDARSGNPRMKGHLLLVVAPILIFFVLQVATGGLQPEVNVTLQSRFGVDGVRAGSGTSVNFLLRAPLVSVVLSTLCLVGAALMYWLVLAQADLHGAAHDRAAALRLVVYAMTPGLVGSLLYALPWVGEWLALAGYILTVRLFRSGAPVMLPPVPEEASRFGRVVGRRAAFLGLALPLLAIIAWSMGFAALLAPNPLPTAST